MAHGGGLPSHVLRLILLLLLLGTLGPVLIVFLAGHCYFLSFNCGELESLMLMALVLVAVVVAKELFLCSCKPGRHVEPSGRKSYERCREARGE